MESTYTYFLQILRYIFSVLTLIFVVFLTVLLPRRKSGRLAKLSPFHEEAQSSVCAICGKFIQSKNISSSYRKSKKNHKNSNLSVSADKLNVDFKTELLKQHPNQFDVIHVVCSSCHKTASNKSRISSLVGKAVDWPIIDCSDEDHCLAFIFKPYKLSRS